MRQHEQIITQGTWANGVPWKFFTVNKGAALPKKENCTAAFCVVTCKGKLVIVQHKNRGWELPGGHINWNENLETTVRREVLEETGASTSEPIFFGYKKASPSLQIEHVDNQRFPDAEKKYYPFPHSFIPYFYAEVEEFFDQELADDVNAVKIVSYTEAVVLFSPLHNHHLIVKHLLDTHQVTLT